MTKRKATDFECLSGTESDTQCRAKTGDELIRTLNAYSSRTFHQNYIQEKHLQFPNAPSAECGTLSLRFKSSSEMTKDELNACFHLIESTSRSDYENSGVGWTPRRKRREMKEDEMRYLLVQSYQPNASQQCSPDGQGSIRGFLSFMLTHDSSPSVPVLYVYEIHLMSQLRKLGLGAHLMQVAEDIAGAAGVEKVMLTCFVDNEKAYSFYARRDYKKDVVSPEDRRTRNKVVKADYAILSKEVR